MGEFKKKAKQKLLHSNGLVFTFLRSVVSSAVSLWEKVKHKLQKPLHSNGLVFTFLRSALSSWAASIADVTVGTILFAICFFPEHLATGCGLIVGGIVNCIINYKFTFHADGCSWESVAAKYTMVWCGNFFLNLYGTSFFSDVFAKWALLESIGITLIPDYLLGRILASILVSWLWNFPLQRYFVYRPTRFDPAAEAIVHSLGIRRKHNHIDKTENNTKE